MKNRKNCSAIASNIPGMMDGGRVTPALLGMGMARRAGEALAGRGRQVSNAIGDEPVQARTAAAPAGAGGMSRIRDGATPPAHMLAAQRRGMADGGARGNADEIETGNGGVVKGPGGPTDDRVGPVALSPTEYVLPGDTVEAMGGPEALDQIRAATHKFVDPKNKPAIAKGLANGGYVVNSMPVEEINIRTPEAYRADKANAIDSAVRKGQRPPGMAKNPMRTPALDRISTNIQARNAPKPAGSRIGSFAKGGAALGGVVGAADSLADIGNGYRDKFQRDMGVETPAGSVVADTARTFGNVGNALTFGIAGRVGEGIASSTSGGSFIDGFKKTPDRAAFLAGQAQPAAPAVTQPAAAPSAAPQAAAPAAPAAQAAPASGTGMPGTPSIPTIGKINASRQPNGVMSFSGSGPVQGYEGPAAGQLKGGGSSGAVTPADYQAAVARAEKDKAGVVSMAASYASQGDRQEAYRMAAGDQAATAAVEQALQQRELRIAALNGNKNAAAILNQQSANETNLSETKLRIAADMTPKPETAYDRERTRGAKADNDRAAVSDGLIAQYMNAPDEKTRNTALERLNALGGKNNSDKYITVDVDTGQKDAVGNPIYAKAPFNTRTGQIASTSGAVGGQQQAPYPDGTKVRLADGSAGIVKDGEAVPIQ